LLAVLFFDGHPVLTEQHLLADFLLIILSQRNLSYELEIVFGVILSKGRFLLVFPNLNTKAESESVPILSDFFFFVPFSLLNLIIFL